MEYNDKVKEKVLTDKDISNLALRSTLLQAAFNYERMQAGGWELAMLPALEKIYKDDKEGLSIAMNDNLEFMNTHPVLAGLLNRNIVSSPSHRVEFTLAMFFSYS